uniref:PRISE-like Rossmann-fold domain-containing protein n=1 Tax=Kalanchoe fedtschenkoi TaxID=63787 RepID=A0A7N0UEB6_KALFE
MSWWWAGAIGAAAKIKPDRVDEGQPRYQSVALVIGVTGIVGTSLAEILTLPDTPGGPWKVYGVARREKPKWIADQVEHIRCDVANRDETLTKLGVLSDVTHVFYMAASLRADESEACLVNGRMLRNALDAVASNVRHVCLQTGLHHYTPPYYLYGKVPSHQPPFRETMARLEYPSYYHALEDVLLDEVTRRGGTLTYSVHRPSIVFGLSPHCQVNFVATLCVYASICKRLGVPMRYPGTKATWEGYWDASDAGLVAEQQIWAAVDPNAKNEAFNCSNGDVFRMKELWRILAEEFGLEWEEVGDMHEGFDLGEMMKDKGPMWEEIVSSHGLEPTELGQVANWASTGYLMNVEPIMGCMNKSREHGFLGFRNSKTSFASSIGKLKAHKIVP